MAGKVSIVCPSSAAVLKVAENQMHTIYEDSVPAPCIWFTATLTEEVADLDLDFNQQKHAGITWTRESSGKQQRHNSANNNVISYRIYCIYLHLCMFLS